MKTTPDYNCRTGASKNAIEKHYGIGNEFYKLWLDPTMTYSCALWQEGDTLEQAQKRKLDYHLTEAKSHNIDRLLDIGCGWGSLIIRGVENFGVKFAVGLTLSEAQYSFVQQFNNDRLIVKIENWEDHIPNNPYDAITSIGAMEHFVKPEFRHEERILKYKQFFDHCHNLLRPKGWISLQTLTYGSGEFKRGPVSNIFPESDMPRFEEIVEAAKNSFEIVHVRNDRLHYAKTAECWLNSLIKNRKLARQHVGIEVVNDYENYLASVVMAMQKRIFCLHRITLQRID